MMQQYHDAKQAAGDALLLFRMGDFYELFYDDAKIAARTLGLALTSRDKGDDPMPMAGFPYHQLDTYLAKIIAAGHRAAICEQVEDPKQAKGLVKREVTRIVTPGTLTDDALLDPQASNFLAAIAHADRRAKPAAPPAGHRLGRCFHRPLLCRRVSGRAGRRSTGPHSAGRAADQRRFATAARRLDERRIDHSPARLGVWPHGGDRNAHQAFRHAVARRLWFRRRGGRRRRRPHCEPPARCSTIWPKHKRRRSHTSIGSLPYSTSERLAIDPATRRSLELVATLRDGRREGSLLGVLDRTVTCLGARLLADWLAAPLTDVAAINARLDAVDELVANATRHQPAPRIASSRFTTSSGCLSRVTTGRASPRDLAFVGRTLACLPKVKAKLTGRTSALLRDLEARLDLCADIRGPLEQALVDDCPLTSRDGGFIRDGYRADLDELRELAAGGKQWMAEYQAAECQRTGIASMKVGFN